ncbi:MAG TPA: HEAT repeat domain-containing protein, partial [Gemmataceae bacterium]|nr:HEAT repeat domain-containing protein [Gemmataceae bacterium]
TPLSTAPAANASPGLVNVIPASNQVSSQVDAVVRQLGDASDTVRRDAAIELGRLKALNAVDALVNVLSKDTSPIARDGAARGLGLIASPRSLNALIYSAQSDNDRDVCHSAQFAVEVIRSNLRANQ